MRSVTVQAMVDEIQVLLEDPDHVVATEAEYIRRLNRASARLYAYYIEAEPDRFRTEATINALAATSAYALPSDWLATLSVDFAQGDTRRPLELLQDYDRNRYVNQTNESRAYRVIGTNVVLYPTPVAGQTYTHAYLPTAPVVDDVADTIDCRLGHEAWLEKFVAREFLAIKQEYDGRWDEDIGKLEAELKLEANFRYFNDVAVMTSEYEQRNRAWPYSWRRGGNAY